MDQDVKGKPPFWFPVAPIMVFVFVYLDLLLSKNILKWLDINLFLGMFENNILTFNPGWDVNANKLDDFDDVREIQRRLKEKVLSWKRKLMKIPADQPALS